MVGKVANLALALGILLAIIAGFIVIPGLNVALVLVVLGLIGGLAFAADEVVRLYVAVLVLPAIGLALANVPAIGGQLDAAATNVALCAAGAAATVLAIRLYNLVKDGLLGLSKS